MRRNRGGGKEGKTQHQERSTALSSVPPACFPQLGDWAGAELARSRPAFEGCDLAELDVIVGKLRAGMGAGCRQPGDGPGRLEKGQKPGPIPGASPVSSAGLPTPVLCYSPAAGAAPFFFPFL